MCWEDMTLYWAWRNHTIPIERPPHVKNILYGKATSGNIKQRIAVAVTDKNGEYVKYQPGCLELINMGERGYTITWPEIGLFSLQLL